MCRLCGCEVEGRDQFPQDFWESDQLQQRGRAGATPSPGLGSHSQVRLGRTCA